MSQEQPGCIRQATDGCWHLMNHREKGWKSFSDWYPSLPQLLAAWKIRLGTVQQDADGIYWTIQDAATPTPLSCIYRSTPGFIPPGTKGSAVRHYWYPSIESPHYHQWLFTSTDQDFSDVCCDETDLEFLPLCDSILPTLWQIISYLMVSTWQNDPTQATQWTRSFFRGEFRVTIPFHPRRGNQQHLRQAIATVAQYESRSLDEVTIAMLKQYAPRSPQIVVSPDGIWVWDKAAQVYRQLQRAAEIAPKTSPCCQNCGAPEPSLTLTATDLPNHLDEDEALHFCGEGCANQYCRVNGWTAAEL